MIPPICHQLWKSETFSEGPLKDATNQVQLLCTELKWKYELWTEPRWKQLFEEHYSFLMKYYDILNNIQRVHLAKYVIIYHHGGMILDADVIPTAILKVWMMSDKELILAKDGKETYSSSILLGSARHEFFKRLIYNVIKYQPIYILSSFKHYDTSHRSGTDMINNNIHSLKKDHSVHVQSEDQPIINKISVPSTWREWDSNLFDTLNFLHTHRYEVLVVSMLAISMMILIMLSAYQKRKSRLII